MRADSTGSTEAPLSSWPGGRRRAAVGPGTVEDRLTTPPAAGRKPARVRGGIDEQQHAARGCGGRGVRRCARPRAAQAGRMQQDRQCALAGDRSVGRPAVRHRRSQRTLAASRAPGRAARPPGAARWAAQGEQPSSAGEEFAVGGGPVEPGRSACSWQRRWLVAAAAADPVAGEQHRRALGEQQAGAGALQAGAQGEHVGRPRSAFHAAVPRVVVRMADGCACCWPRYGGGRGRPRRAGRSRRASTGS